MICQQEQAARCVKANSGARKTRSLNDTGMGEVAIGKTPKESYGNSFIRRQSHLQ